MTPPQPAGRVRWGSVERCAAEGRGPAPAHATSAVRARPGRPAGGMTGHLTAFLLAAAHPAPCGTAWRGRAPAPSSRTGVALVCDGGLPGRPPQTPRVSGRSQGSCRSIIPDPAPSSLKHGEKWRHPQINRGRESFAAGPVLAKAQGSPSSGRKRRRRGTRSRGRAWGAPRSTGGRPHAERAVTGPRLADATLHSLRDVIHLSGYADVIICDFKNVKCGDRRQSHRKRAEKMHET